MVRALVRAVVLLAGISLAGPATAQNSDVLERALASALDSFEGALPALGGEVFGVNVAEYRDALSLQRFSSGRWGGTVSVSIEMQADEGGQCARFAAFTRVPPRDGAVPLVLCPRFFAPGADELRTLTILHEMVHVVAGTDECRAMAFAAAVEQQARGRWTPVDAYWRASGCGVSGFRLPG
ncbi:hypothetical protein [Devosia submarina]|uniref:hypothetical protein n=1 Tax=Devosia submarina TaxID=1173082 RepID=UPI001300344A|nr:hypothetical protein [Devosia submarina]